MALVSRTARRIRRTAALALGLLLLPACGPGPAIAPEATRPAPERIVVMAPAAAEMLDALGALDLVVGIGDFVERPLGITGLPRVGGYDSPNVERALALGADLLITTSSEAGSAAHARLESLGVPVLALDTSTYDGVFAALEAVGRAVGRSAAAADLARGIRRELAAIAERAAGAERRRVLVIVGRDPLYVAGPGSHIDEMIALAGGVNVAADAGAPYPRLSLEAILERAPEVIVDASDNRPDARLGRDPGEWSRFPFLPAVRERRVYHVAPASVVIPGIRLPEMTRLMGAMIHPEVFGEPGGGGEASR